MSDAFEMVRNHLSFYHDFSIGWLNDIGKTFKRGTLTSSIDTEQRETFTSINGEACLLYSQYRLREHGLVDLSKWVYANKAVLTLFLNSVMLDSNIMIQIKFFISLLWRQCWLKGEQWATVRLEFGYHENEEPNDGMDRYYEDVTSKII